MYMSFESKVVKNAQTVEYGKFVELQNDSRFPPISVVRLSPWDQSNAFPENAGKPPLTAVEIYPKYAVLTHLTNPEDIKVSLSAENINVNLADVENLVGETNTLLLRTNTLLNSSTALSDTANRTYLPSISSDVSDIESLLRQTNTLLTANSSNTSYLIPKAYITVTTSGLTSRFFTNFGGVSGYLKNIKGINTTPEPSLPGAEVYVQIWTGSNILVHPNSRLLFTYSVPTESNFDIVFPDGIEVSPLWIVGSLTSTTYTPAADSLFLTVTYTT